MICASLAGCGSLSESTTDALFAAPGRFDIYTCRDLAKQELATRKRVDDLEVLMRRAQAGTAGTVVATVAYRSDFLRARAELKLIHDTAVRRKCDLRELQSEMPAQDLNAAPQLEPRAPDLRRM